MKKIKIHWLKNFSAWAGIISALIVLIGGAAKWTLDEITEKNEKIYELNVINLNYELKKYKQKDAESIELIKELQAKLVMSSELESSLREELSSYTSEENKLKITNTCKQIQSLDRDISGLNNEIDRFQKLQSEEVRASVHDILGQKLLAKEKLESKKDKLMENIDFKCEATGIRHVSIRN